MIRCCKDCKAPKRHPGCHATCPEYIEQKEKHEQDRQAKWNAQAVKNNLTAQRAVGVYKANKSKRR
jgi:hypothetical protein